jgi:hypothetical protein
MPIPNDDDANFETVIGHDGRPVRILRDGAHIMVGLMMADAARRGSGMLHDGYGGPVGRKPGFIISDASQATRDEAYRLSVRELTTAWQGATGDAARSAEVEPISAADAVSTDLKTLMARLDDARRSAYGTYCRELQDAWRR